MSPRVKKLLNYAFLFFTLGLVLYIGFKGNDIPALLEALSNFSPVYLLLCLLGWLLYIAMDALSLFFFLRQQGHPISYGKALYTSILGVYYCNITPGASGGQPMQIYQLRQMGVPIGISGSALTVKFFSFQLMLLVVGGILWIAQRSFVALHAQGTTWLIVLGYIINFLSISMVLTMAINKRAVRLVITLCIRVGVKLRICKNPKRSAAKWEAHCASFLSSVQLIRSRPKELLLQFVIGILQLFALMSITLSIYYAFGLSSANPIQLLTMGVLLYISASYTPLPGASGAQEGGFALFFQDIFPDAYLFVALLIWRFCTYYISIIVGLPISLWGGIRSATMQKSDNASPPSTTIPQQQEGVPHSTKP